MMDNIVQYTNKNMQPVAKYYITGTEEYSKYLINELSV